MSRTINESVQLLTETLGNCKTALTEKEVTDVDNIKISDVDEKIAEISAGGDYHFSEDTFIKVEIKETKYTEENAYSKIDFGKRLVYSANSIDLRITLGSKIKENTVVHLLTTYGSDLQGHNTPYHREEKVQNNMVTFKSIQCPNSLVCSYYFLCIDPVYNGTHDFVPDEVFYFGFYGTLTG